VFELWNLKSINKQKQSIGTFVWSSCQEDDFDGLPTSDDEEKKVPVAV
jgi:hypothetical protein